MSSRWSSAEPRLIDRCRWAILVREILVRESQDIKRKQGYRPVERPAAVTTRNQCGFRPHHEKPPAFPCFPQARLSLNRGRFLLRYQNDGPLSVHRQHPLCIRDSQRSGQARGDLLRNLRACIRTRFPLQSLPQALPAIGFQ